jgi:eukaryotic-like serine/threonine-protein kinase
MKQEEWAKVKEILWLALELPADSREDFLQKECCGDSQLIAEIKSLIEASEESDQLLENENYSASSVVAKREESSTGKSFGNYKIIRELGRGGMGVVFLAERADGEFMQNVALKVIRQSFADERLENRFRRERQILASLNHPNIAALHDGGVTRRGEPFLVMEYVEGETLLDYAEAHELSVENRLKLFLKICSAVSYAHRNLIVHRDIKPGNIIVTKDGEPKLLDFGLAKILDENFAANKTETALHAFTPSYASPEQIHGKNITTASDVYSLGIVLYELLTGHNPFHFEDKRFEEILKTIDYAEPVRPSSVVVNQFSGSNASSSGNEGQATNPKSKIQNPKSLRGDLDNITLKALRKEPERRYKSVEEFTADIERHLNDLPISARPNNLSYLASRFFKRNKIIVSAVALVILALAVGLAVALWQANEARKERDLAERRFQDVRKLSNSLLFEISPKFERLQGSTEARKVLVERALEYLDNLAAESNDDSQIQSELAFAYEKIGDLQGSPRKPNLGEFSEAVKSYEKAQSIRKSLIESQINEPEQKRWLAANNAALSNIRFWQDDYQNSLSDAERALNLYQELIAEQPDSLQLKLEQADLELDTAYTHYFNNEIPQAYPYFQKSLLSLENLEKQQPANTEILRLIGKGRTLLGTTFSWDRKQKEAEAEMNKAIVIMESLVSQKPNDAILKQDLIRTYLDSSGIYEDINNDLCFQYAQKAHVLAEKVFESDTANTQARHNLAQAYSKLGISYNYLEKSDLAASSFENSAKILAALEKNEPNNLTYKKDIARNYRNFGLIKTKQGDFIDAIADHEKSIAAYEMILKADTKNNLAKQQIGTAYRYIAETYEKFAKADKTQKRNEYLYLAKVNFQRALDIYQQLDSQNALTAFDKIYLSEIKLAAEKYSQAAQ